MTKIITKTVAVSAAREFVRDFVRTGRDWDTEALAGYLPEGFRLPASADYAGSATITDIAEFLRAEAVAG